MDATTSSPVGRPMPRLSKPLAALAPDYDAVVVGSGYGGGTAASRLARMGLRIALLERGREIPVGEYPDTFAAIEQIQVSHAAGHIGDRRALVHLHRNDDLNVVVGCGLGGTSLINANVAIEAVPAVLADPVWPAALRADTAGFTEGYRRARDTLRPAPYPDDPQTPKLAKLDALAAAAAATGASFMRPPIAVTFQDTINPQGIFQRGCTLCGDCCSGCNVGAKNTTLMNYLPDAVGFGATVICEAHVQRVERGKQRRWRVVFLAVDRPDGTFAPEESAVEADIVVLGAGALGSTEILLRSKKYGLDLSDRLGKGFSGNGDFLAFGYNCDRPINGIGMGRASALYDPQHPDRPPVGPTITGMIDRRVGAARDDGFVVEEGAIPGALGALLPEIIPLAKPFGRDTDAGVPDAVTEYAREIESLLRGARHGAVANTQTLLIMAHDGADGEVVLDGDRARVRWPGVGGKPVFRRIVDYVDKVVASWGGTSVPNPLWAKLFGRGLVTVHPLGGCPMGEDAATGVVDHACRVFAGKAGTQVHEGLLVCDGSIMPRSLGVNPLLTITALSERAMALLSARLGKPVDWRQTPALPSAPATIGVRFTERMAGTVSDHHGTEAELAFVATVTVADLDRFIADPAHDAPLAGVVTCPLLHAEPLDARGGRFNLFIEDAGKLETKRMDYRMPLVSRAGRHFLLLGHKTIHDDRGFDLWRDTTTLAVTVHDGDEKGPVVATGELTIATHDFIKQIRTMTVTGAPDAQARLLALGRFGHYFAGQIFDSFGEGFAKPVVYDPARVRQRRALRAPAPEVRWITTRDGKKLRLTRYRGGARGPVILSHGLGVSSLIFSIDTLPTNFLEALVAQEFDCWLLDYRASIDLPSAEEPSTADDVARIDYPAAVAAVREWTGAPSVQMVAHCYGAMTFTMAMLAGLEGVRSAVISQIAAHAVVPFWTQRLVAYLHAPDFLRLAGVKYVDARATTERGAFERLVDGAIGLLYPFAAEDRTKSLTSRRITALYGPLYDLSNLDPATFDAVPEMFGKANIQAFLHLARIARAGHVVSADGGDDYLPHASRFRIPTLFIHGERNRCFRPAGTAATRDMLAAVNGAHYYQRQVIADTGHIDCIFGRNADRDVYPLAARHLLAT